MRSPVLALVLAAALAAPAAGWAQAQRTDGFEEGNVTYTPATDPTVNAARDEAQRTLPLFLAKWRSKSGKATDFMFKGGFPMDDGSDNLEHMWVKLEKVSRDGSLTGTLDNTPVHTTKVKLYDRVTVAPARISDWLYWVDGRMYGQYTGRALLARMQPEDRARLAEVLSPTPLEAEAK